MSTQLVQLLDKVGNKLFPKAIAYDVGDIFITTRSGNPSQLLGYGAWEQICDRFLLASGSREAGSTGGESYHTLSINEMPSHAHRFSGSGYSGATTTNAINLSGGAYSMPSFGRSAGYGSEGYVLLTNTGGGQAHNNMPPYLTVNIWKRTA